MRSANAWDRSSVGLRATHLQFQRLQRVTRAAVTFLYVTGRASLTDRSPAGLETEAGIGVGSTVGQLTATYDSAIKTQGRLRGPNFDSRWPVGFLTSGTTDTVTSVSAAGCGSRRRLDDAVGDEPSWRQGGTEMSECCRSPNGQGRRFNRMATRTRFDPRNLSPSAQRNTLAPTYENADSKASGLMPASSSADPGARGAVVPATTRSVRHRPGAVGLKSTGRRAGEARRESASSSDRTGSEIGEFAERVLYEAAAIRISMASRGVNRHWGFGHRRLKTCALGTVRRTRCGVRGRLCWPMKSRT